MHTESDARDVTGLLLGRLTTLPALIFLPFLLTSFPLLLLGWFKPVPAIALWVLVTALIVPYAWRRIPSVTGAGLWGTAAAGLAKPTPRWTLWSLLAVSVAFGAFNAVFHSQFVLIEYDAASYMQIAQWISAHGTTVIPNGAQYFGDSSSVSYASAAFYQVGNHIVPQFMAGLPMVLSTGYWAGGMRLAVLWAPVLGALAVFTFGGLVARLVGPRWAPFAALAIAVTIPMQYASRSTWSEPLAMILLVGGLSLWIDSQRTDRGELDARAWRSGWRAHARSASHVLAFLAGLLLGMVFLVRVDGPADIAFIIPYCGLLILRRQRQVVPLIAGLLVGTVYGSVDAAFVSAPYLIPNNTQSAVGMSALVIAMFLGTVLLVRWLRRRGSELRNPPKRWLVRAVTLLPFFIVVVELIRPFAEPNWKALQYAPLSLHWVYWYVGAGTVAFMTVAYAMLGRRAVKGESPVWVLPLLVFSWALLFFLIRPAINPHQPYASRRLVPAVLPGIMLVSIWLASRITQRSRVLRLVNVPSWLRRSPRVVVGALCVAVIAASPLYGNVTGLAFKRTFENEIANLNGVCAGIPAGKSVLFVDNLDYGWFGGPIRNTCDIPVAGVRTTDPQAILPDIGQNVAPATMIAAVAAIEGSGHQPYVLGASPAEFAPLQARFGNGTVKMLASFQTDDDEHIYLGTPRDTVSERFTLYSWEPSQ